MSYFSEKIKKLRTERDLTQKELAEEIGMSQGNYSGLESGKYDPSLSALKALSDFYNEFIDTLVRPIRIVEDEELSEDEREVIDVYNQLDEDAQTDIKDFMEVKLKRQRQKNL